MSVFKDKEKTKDGRQWRFKVYYHNSEGKLVPYTSKRYMLEKEAKAEERVFLLNRDTPVKKKFQTIADDYFNDLKQRVRESSYLMYKSLYKFHIQEYFEGKYIDTIDVIDIEKWKQFIQSQKIKIKTCNQCYVVLNEIFKFAGRKYGMKYNPASISGRFKTKNDEVIETKNRLRYITYDEFNKFINVIDNPLWHAFFMTLYLTGMRKGEIIALTWHDIDWNRNTIAVNKTVSLRTETGKYKITATKTGVNREITMSNILIQELKKYHEIVQQYGDYSDDWFIFGNGDLLSVYHISKYKDYYFKLADLENKKITVHEFRHSHVSLCINEYLKSGQNDSTKFFIMMSQRMGHSLPIMQQVYMHLFPSVQDRIVDLLNNL